MKREKNRLAARKSRQKRQSRLSDLQHELTGLEDQSRELHLQGEELQRQLRLAKLEASYLNSIVHLYHLQEEVRQEVVEQQGQAQSAPAGALSQQQEGPSNVGSAEEPAAVPTEPSAPTGMHSLPQGLGGTPWHQG